MDKSNDKNNSDRNHSNADSVSNGHSLDATATLRPPALQLRAQHKSSGTEVEQEIVPIESPFQLASEGSNPPSAPEIPNGNDGDGTNQKKSNSTGLPDNLKSGVENLSGFSLNDVNVHYNSDKPAQLQAHAYAQGTDIHIASGQEKHLPHEAWHVVQQKQGRVHPTKQLKAFNINDDVGLEKEADVMGTKAMQSNSIQLETNAPDIQLQSSSQNANASDTAQLAAIARFISKNTHAHKLKGTNVNSGRFGQIGKQLKPGTSVQVDDSDFKLDKSGARFLKLVGGEGYIRETSLAATNTSAKSGLQGIGGTAASDMVEEDADDNEAGIEDVNSTMDEVGGNLGDLQDQFDESNIELTSGQEQGIGATAAVASFGAGAFGIAMAIKTLASSDSEIEDKVEAVFDLLSSTASTVSAVGSGINTFSSAADAASKAKVAAVDPEAAKAMTESSLTSASDSVASWAGSVADGINAIKEAVFAIRDVYVAFKDAQSNEGSSSQEKFEQGMGVVMRLMESAASAVSSIKGILEIFEQGIGGLKEAVPGLSIALSGAQIGMKVYHIIKSNLSRKDIQKERVLLDATHQPKFMKTKNKKLGSGTYEKFSRTKLKQEIKRLETKAVAGPLTSAEQTELDGLNEYDFLLEMEYINKKRMKRSGLKIGIELVKIAGDISTLTGYGAVAGVPLKAFAAGADIGSSVFRKIKQAGRDKANRSADDSRWRNVFAAEKNSDNKKAKRRKDAKFIFKQFAKIPSDQSSPNYEKQVSKVETYMSAAGAHPKSVYREFTGEGGGEPGLRAAMKAVVEAMATRD